MSQSTPADIAIALRSLPRRLREASVEADDQDAVKKTAQVVDRAIEDAANLMGCRADVGAIADAINERRIVDWAEDQLQALRSGVTTAGTAIRALQDLAESQR